MSPSEDQIRPLVDQPTAVDAARPNVTQEDIAVTIATLNDPKIRGAWDRDWERSWSNFLADPLTRLWAERRHVHGEEPVYCLPEELIESLSTSRGRVETTSRQTTGRRARAQRSGPILDSADAQAERMFTALCQGWEPSCVGIWSERPLQHGLLGPASSSDNVSDRMLDSLVCLNGSVEAKRAQLQAIEPETARVQKILRHRAGQLFGASRFVKALRELKRLWLALSTRPPLPLKRIAQSTAGNDETLDKEEREFLSQVRTFLDVWELIEIVSWDLVSPMGPFVNVPLRMPLNGVGEVTISSVYPSYWPKTKSTSLIARLELSSTAALGEIAERIGDEPSANARAYEMRLAELALRSRYRSVPRGSIERLKEAFSERWGVSLERITQIRDIYYQNLA